MLDVYSGSVEETTERMKVLRKDAVRQVSVIRNSYTKKERSEGRYNNEDTLRIDYLENLQDELRVTEVTPVMYGDYYYNMKILIGLYRKLKGFHVEVSVGTDGTMKVSYSRNPLRGTSVSGCLTLYPLYALQRELPSVPKAKLLEGVVER